MAAGEIISTKTKVRLFSGGIKVVARV